MFVTDANDERPEFQNLPFTVDVAEVSVKPVINMKTALSLV